MAMLTSFPPSSFTLASASVREVMVNNCSCLAFNAMTAPATKPNFAAWKDFDFIWSSDSGAHADDAEDDAPPASRGASSVRDVSFDFSTTMPVFSDNSLRNA